jgi:hypothetical protein
MKLPLIHGDCLEAVQLLVSSDNRYVGVPSTSYGGKSMAVADNDTDDEPVACFHENDDDDEYFYLADTFDAELDEFLVDNNKCVH